MVLAIASTAVVVGTIVATGGAGAVGGVAAAASGGGAAAGIASTVGAAAEAGATILIASGPVGWIALGANDQGLTWDCYRAVLHEPCSLPTSPKIAGSWMEDRGRALRDVIADPRIRNVRVGAHTKGLLEAGRALDTSELPRDLQLENVWGEIFAIRFVRIPNGRLAAHAERIN